MDKILIVDDNPDVAFMLREKVAQFIRGEITTTLGGEECLTLARKDGPDLILLDISMPKINGFEVCRLLKKDPRTKHIPIIFLTAAYNDLRSKIKGLDLGADDYMVHPVDDLELTTRVRNLLVVKHLRDEIRSLKDRLGETDTAPD